jgi:hypothetical protein
MRQADFAYARQELEALFRYANEQDVERGGHSDVRSAAINTWNHHRALPAARDELDIIGTFYVRWGALTLWEVETDEGLSLGDLMIELGRLER